MRAKIAKQLENAGVLGPEIGIHPRKVLMSYTDFMQLENNYTGTFKEYTPHQALLHHLPVLICHAFLSIIINTTIWRGMISKNFVPTFY